MCIEGEDRKPFGNGSGRLELAEAIASPDNPLTARVIVNRVWGHHFDSHLVGTPSDFGTRSDPPTHPELLDWLAATFIEDGWSLKQLHRRIMLSAAFQQQSFDRPECRAVDPENQLLWRMNRRRLDLEAMRDSFLAAAGRLERTIGGPSVKLTEEPFPTRRSAYAFVERQNLPGMFRTFDFASPDVHTPQRPETSVPQQALYQMNSPFVQEQAVHLAARSEAAATDPAQRILQLYRLVLGRDPQPDEIALGLDFVQTPPSDESPPAASPWQYGWGEFDQGSGRVARFEKLRHWTGSEWQGGLERPDPEIGWVILNAAGGHAGNDRHHATIRRWIAPRDGVVRITGRLRHRTEQGDGVLCRIVSVSAGQLKEWTVHNNGRRTELSGVHVRAGDTIDFVTECRDNPHHDSFEWIVTLHMEPAAPGAVSEWNSGSGFHGPQPEPMGPWEQYAQALMLSNEFLFVD